MSMFYEVSPQVTGTYLNTPRSPVDPDRFKYRLMFQPGLVEDVPDLRYLASADTVADWPMAINRMRLVSPRMRDILDTHAGGRDAIQWLPATITTPDGKEHPYWVPHFHVWHDVLDEEHSNVGPNGTPIRWVIALRKLDGLNVFIAPRTGGSVVVRDTVLTAMREANITGYDVDPARQV